jgi:hypothetical protein
MLFLICSPVARTLPFPLVRRRVYYSSTYCGRQEKEKERRKEEEDKEERQVSKLVGLRSKDV